MARGKRKKRKGQKRQDSPVAAEARSKKGKTRNEETATAAGLARLQELGEQANSYLDELLAGLDSATDRLPSFVVVAARQASEVVEADQLVESNSQTPTQIRAACRRLAHEHDGHAFVAILAVERDELGDERLFLLGEDDQSGEVAQGVSWLIRSQGPPRRTDWRPLDAWSGGEGLWEVDRETPEEAAETDKLAAEAVERILETLKLDLQAQLAQLPEPETPLEDIVLTVNQEHGVKRHQVPRLYPRERQAELVEKLSRADQALVSGTLVALSRSRDESQELVLLVAREFIRGSSRRLGAVISRRPGQPASLAGWFNPNERG